MTELQMRNPHSILQVLARRPKDVIEVVFPREKNDDVWDQIHALCEKNKVRMKEALPRVQSKPGMKPMVGGRDSSHGALIRPKQPVSIETLLKYADQHPNGVWLALDNLQDPQNVGAIFRSAAFFGIQGIIMTTERSAPMTATVYDIASGGVETVPFAAVINLKQALNLVKDAEIWILGTSEHAKESLKNVKQDRRWCVVVGNEENGMRRLTEEACDMTVSIPARSKGVTSLNVSVATGVMLNHLTL